MANEVAQANNNALSVLANISKGLRNVQQATPTSTMMAILRLGRDGVWIYGQENIEIEEGSLWAVNPESFQHGYVCWTNYPEEDKRKNELLGEALAPMSSEPLDPANLQDHGWPWTRCASVSMKCISGDDEGEEVVYKPSSTGGLNFIHALLELIQKRLDETNTTAIIPVITLENDYYNHKKWGKTYVPTFQHEDWLKLGTGAPEHAEHEDAEQQEEAPKKKTKRANGKSKAGHEMAPVEDQSTDVDDVDTSDSEDEAPAPAARTRRRRRS